MGNVDSVPDRADETPAGEPLELGRTPKYNRMTLAELDLLARMAAQGRSGQEMAAALNRAESTISEALARLRRTSDLTKALLAADDVPALQDWRHARRKAAKRGDHRPAREWLEMAHPELRPPPQNQHSQGGSVTIIIGTPQSPLQLPDIDVSTPTLLHGSASGTRAPSVEIQPPLLTDTDSPIAPIGVASTTQTASPNALPNTSANSSISVPGGGLNTGAALEHPSPDQRTRAKLPTFAPHQPYLQAKAPQNAKESPQVA